MIRLEGHYLDGLKPVCVPAVMDFSDEQAALSAGTVFERYAISNLRASPRIGSADRFITLPNGAQFACADHAVLDSLPQESWSEGPVAWLEHRWGVALACIVIVFGALLAGYFIGLPAAAERIVAHIPIRAEEPLGKQAVGWLDEKGLLKPTGLDFITRQTIKDGFEGLCGDLQSKDCYRLEFRSSKGFGPNAFAFPGGVIVITDDMVKAAASREEVLAVLAHEVGHVELRHTLRSILQNSVIGAAAAMVTSDAASLSVAVAGLPMLLAQTRYSRKFETEADEYAFRLLRQKAYSPAAFALLMERLAKAKEAKQAGAFPYLSSHPLTAERVERARAAAKGPMSALQSGKVDQGSRLQSLSPEDKRLLLVGAWFGCERTKEGGRHVWIIQRKDDGTYEAHSGQADASGKMQDIVAVGNWGVEGDIFYSVRTRVLKGDEAAPAGAANAPKRNNFKILNLTGEILEYQRVDSKNRITVRRVPASFDLSAGWEYFVSRKGFTQEYSYTFNRGSETTQGRLESVIGPKTNLDGMDVYATVITIWKPGAGPLSTKCFSVESVEGVKSIACQGPSDDSPKTGEQDAWSLKYPLIVGRSWTSTEEINSLKEKFTAPVTCVVEAVDDVVSVPAGTFKNCMRIKQSFNGKVNFGSNVGEVEVALEYYSWYAPGLGYIKTVENIKCANRDLGGGESRLQMLSYRMVR